MTTTNGNIIVENIKVGDIHYEFAYGCGIKCEVLTLPVRDEDGLWTWKSKNLNTGEEIEYAVHENYPHYSSELYDCEAYRVSKWI